MRPLEWSRGESCLNARRELAAVDELLELGGAVLVEGGTCIGKTALLETACPRAARLGREVLRRRPVLVLVQDDGEPFRFARKARAVPTRL